MKKSPLAFLKDQSTKLPPVATADLNGKTVVVTGANVGLGFEAAKHFARMNPSKLILGCRSEEKGKNAVDSEFWHSVNMPPGLTFTLRNQGRYGLPRRRAMALGPREVLFRYRVRGQA